MTAGRALALESRSRRGFPAPHRPRLQPREPRMPGDAFGRERIGVDVTMPPPGMESPMRRRRAAIGNRVLRGGPVHYADVDPALRVDAESRPAYTHNDGTPY